MPSISSLNKHQNKITDPYRSSHLLDCFSDPKCQQTIQQKRLRTLKSKYGSVASSHSYGRPAASRTPTLAVITSTASSILSAGNHLPALIREPSVISTPISGSFSHSVQSASMSEASAKMLMLSEKSMERAVFPTDSWSALLYIMTILVIYIIIFSILVISNFGNSSKSSADGGDSEHDGRDNDENILDREEEGEGVENVVDVVGVHTKLKRSSHTKQYRTMETYDGRSRMDDIEEEVDFLNGNEGVEEEKEEDWIEITMNEMGAPDNFVSFAGKFPGAWSTIRRGCLLMREKTRGGRERRDKNQSRYPQMSEGRKKGKRRTAKRRRGIEEQDMDWNVGDNLREAGEREREFDEKEGRRKYFKEEEKEVEHVNKRKDSEKEDEENERMTMKMMRKENRSGDGEVNPSKQQLSFYPFSSPHFLGGSSPSLSSSRCISSPQTLPPPPTKPCQGDGKRRTGKACLHQDNKDDKMTHVSFLEDSEGESEREKVKEENTSYSPNEMRSKNSFGVSDEEEKDDLINPFSFFDTCSQLDELERGEHYEGEEVEDGEEMKSVIVWTGNKLKVKLASPDAEENL